MRGSDFVQKRGLSKSKICIAVAIVAFRNVVAVTCGHGKPSSKRIKDALLSHIAPGSVIVHDKERSHPALVKAAKCTDESYKADVADPAYLEAMELVNSLCSWLRRCFAICSCPIPITAAHGNLSTRTLRNSRNEYLFAVLSKADQTESDSLQPDCSTSAHGDIGPIPAHAAFQRHSRDATSAASSSPPHTQVRSG